MRSRNNGVVVRIYDRDNSFDRELFPIQGVYTSVHLRVLRVCVCVWAHPKMMVRRMVLEEKKMTSIYP